MNYYDILLARKLAGGGGSPASLQAKSVTITQNGETTVLPDAGYDGLSRVNVTVAIPVWDGNGEIS